MTGENEGFEEVELKTGIDPLFFAETMTTDVELIDALFDLIDNSIDAARNIIIANSNYHTDPYGLPSDYSGYKIKLTFSKDKISISDNCQGIESEVIENRAFYTGRTSNHRFGIGHYGLGLKRALLKTGKTFSLESDNGINLYVAKFSHDVLSGDKEKSLKAQKYPSNNTLGTLFSAHDLKADVINQITSEEWFENSKRHLSIRYSIFLKKGLSIILESNCFSKATEVEIRSELPNMRVDGPLSDFSYELQQNEITAGVSAFFNVGVHHKYKFPGEYAHSLASNKAITEEFGIYFICNDRVIVSHSFEKKYGFTTSFHSEYNGFLCYVRMVSEDPALLPWNTAKTEIKVHNPLFAEILKPIESLASTYRSKAKAVISTWLSPDIKNLPDEERRKEFHIRLNLDGNPEITNQSSTVSQANLFDKSSDPQQIKSSPNNANGAKKNKKRHTNNWKTLLPDHFPISPDDEILNNMLIEAATLKIEDAPHASCLLYRSLLEASLKLFIKKSGHYKSVIDHYFEKGEGKTKNQSEEYKKHQDINLSMSLRWLLDTPDVFSQEDRKNLALCVKNARIHVPKMNGVVHCKNIISDSEVIKIRNETIKLLEFLVTLGVTTT